VSRRMTGTSAWLANCLLVFGVGVVSAQAADVKPLFGPDSPKTLFGWSTAREEEPEEEDPRLVTDRPHVAEASSLVGYGRSHLETGYSFFRDRDQGVVTTTHSFPEPLLRAGVLADWFEFRLAYNYLVETTRDPVAGHSRLSGSDDVYIGAKLALTEQSGFLPEIALFPQARVPTGSSAFTTGQVMPGFNLAYSWKVNDLLEVECNTQMNRRRDDDNHFYSEFTQIVNLEYDLSRRLNAFTEWIVFVPSGALAAQTQHYFHGGFYYFVTPNVQIDISAGVGLNKAADDLAFTGTGLSIRW
jgi:Putative MetA-pathway of phenol degradation